MDISQLQFRDKNPRLIKAENLEKLKNSIKDDPDFLTKRKILVNDTKDGMIVYAGNQRLRSLLALGYTEVPDEWIDIEKNIPLKLMEKRAFKDNVEYGEYDHDKLKDFDLEFLKELDLPEGELDLSELNDIDLDEEKEDSVPEPAKEAKLIEIGDIIQLGPHRIMCGDSTVKEDVDKLMDGKKADMVFTDPPYGMNAVSKSGVLKERYGTDILGDDNSDVAINSFLLCMELGIKDMVFRGANYYPSCLPESGCWIVWDKNNGGSDQADCELARTNYKGVVRKFVKASEKTNRVHPTQKPIELIEWTFNRWDSGNGILDLFLGSGSTLIACEKTNRVCYGMELSPQYIEVIIKRYNDYTKGAREIKCLNRDLDLTQLYAQ